MNLSAPLRMLRRDSGLSHTTLGYLFTVGVATGLLLVNGATISGITLNGIAASDWTELVKWASAAFLGSKAYAPTSKTASGPVAEAPAQEPAPSS